MEAPIGFMVALNPNPFKSKISNCSQEGIFFWGGPGFLGHGFTVKDRDQGGRRYGRRAEELGSRGRGNGGRP
jgi:hypothetical protein